jgi:hypothetical protein
MIVGMQNQIPLRRRPGFQLLRVELRWVSERLSMGHYTRVTQAVSRAERRPGRKLNQIKRKLLRLGTGKKDKQ